MVNDNLPYPNRQSLESRGWQRDRHGWHPPDNSLGLLRALGERAPVPDARVLDVRDAMSELVADMRRRGFRTEIGQWWLPGPWVQHVPLSFSRAVEYYLGFYRSGLLP